MKRGKAADIDGLTVEHLQHCHPVLSVLLCKFLGDTFVSLYT